MSGTDALRRIAALAAVVSLVACGNETTGQRIPLGGPAGEAALELPPALQLQLDSGNAAFRARDYDAAVRHFTAAVQIDPGLAAAWYGIGMAESARGDARAAESAMAQVHRLAPGVPLEHPVSAAPPNPHPTPPPAEGTDSGG